MSQFHTLNLIGQLKVYHGISEMTFEDLGAVKMNEIWMFTSSYILADI